MFTSDLSLTVFLSPLFSHSVLLCSVLVCNQGNCGVLDAASSHSQVPTVSVRLAERDEQSAPPLAYWTARSTQLCMCERVFMLSDTAKWDGFPLQSACCKPVQTGLMAVLLENCTVHNLIIPNADVQWYVYLQILLAPTNTPHITAHKTDLKCLAWRLYSWHPPPYPVCVPEPTVSLKPSLK